MLVTPFAAQGSQPSQCRALNYVDYTNFAISLVLLIGILLSYLPQHYRIISRGTSFGLSPYFVLLGTTSATSAFANIIVLPPSRTSIECCRVISGFACTAGLLGVAQITVQWVCFTIIMLLFLVYFPRATPSTVTPATTTDNDNQDDQDNADSDTPAPPSYRSAIIVVAICILYAIALGIASTYAILAAGQSPRLAWRLADGLGITATVLASVQYFPQIYTTYKLQSLGSLSIPMMCVQTPGGYLWAASLAARLGWEGWSAWILYVFISTLQGVVLGMGLWFKWKKRGQVEDDEEEDDDGNNVGEVDGNRIRNAEGRRGDAERGRNEQTPLLRSDNR